nr:MAG TPA: hypothetical protein [Bacteriophage sp.]
MDTKCIQTCIQYGYKMYTIAQNPHKQRVFFHLSSILFHSLSVSIRQALRECPNKCPAFSCFCQQSAVN